MARRNPRSFLSGSKLEGGSKIYKWKFVGLDKSRKRIRFIRNFALTQSGQIILNALQPSVATAKQLAPVRSGAYRRSIHAFIISDRPPVIIAGFGSTLEYSIDLEFGSSPRAPNGILRPAWARNRVQFNLAVASKYKAAVAGGLI